MAQYKVLQDIEAEDKLVGPLTLRQFIYAAITAVCLYLCFIAITKHVLFMLPIFLLPGALTGFFAFPWGRDQPTEIWALAKIRFLFKPRRRVWNQSGVKELVTVTAPKKIEVSYTDGLSQTEVKSRLKALADTIDTRGWAIKNVTAGLYQSPIRGGQASERLIDISNLPAELPSVDNRSANDIMDVQTSSVAHTFDTMIRASDEAHRQQIIESMSKSPKPPQQVVSDYQPTNQQQPQIPVPEQPPIAAPSLPSPPAPTDNYWFMGQAPAVQTQTQIVAPGSTTTKSISVEPTAEERALARQLREQNNSQGISNAHLHTVLPLSEQKALAEKAAQDAAAIKARQASVTRQPDPAIIALASNNDLNVATIARQASKQNEQPPDEVVISLH